EHRRDQRCGNRHDAAPQACIRSGSRRDQPAQAPGPDLEEGILRRRRSLGRRRMGRIRPQAVKLARWVALISAILPLAAQESVIRVNVRLVRLLVTVKDAKGGLVGTLNKNNFSVYDN